MFFMNKHLFQTDCVSYLCSNRQFRFPLKPVRVNSTQNQRPVTGVGTQKYYTKKVHDSFTSPLLLNLCIINRTVKKSNLWDS